MGASADVTKAYMEYLESLQVDEVKRLNEAQEAAPASANRTLQGLYGPIYDECDKISELEFSFRSGDAETDVLRTHDELEIEYRFRLNQPVTDLNVSLVFIRKDGLWMSAISTLNGDLVKEIHDGEVHCRVRIADCHLNPGNYVLVMPVHEGKSYLWRNIVKEFVVVSRERFTWHLTDFDYTYEVLNGTGGGVVLTEQAAAGATHPPAAGHAMNASASPATRSGRCTSARILDGRAADEAGRLETVGVGGSRRGDRAGGSSAGQELLLVVSSAGRGGRSGSPAGAERPVGMHLARTPVSDRIWGICGA